jgi:ABC-type antimicrobial peptide transport system permease subunit
MVLAPAIRDIVRSLDPSIPIPEVLSLEDVLRGSIAERRLRMTPAIVLGVLALLVALVGVAGTLARMVTERRRELAIRATLGASPRQLIGSVVGHGLGLIGAAVVLGAGGAAWAGQGLQGLLYGVGPFDPGTLALVVLVLGVTSALAVYVPARIATRVQPVDVLRAD